jgi:hypothetical protein
MGNVMTKQDVGQASWPVWFDPDFCVVLPDEAPESLYRDRTIHGRFWGLRAAVDVVRLPSSDFDARAAHVVASLPATILREGRLLYDARRIAA